MLPAGLGFNAISAKALDAADRARLPRSYWDWKPIIEAFNDLMLAGTLCGVEMGLRLAGVPVPNGVDAALDRLALEPVAV